MGSTLWPQAQTRLARGGIPCFKVQLQKEKLSSVNEGFNFNHSKYNDWLSIIFYYVNSETTVHCQTGIVVHG